MRPSFAIGLSVLLIVQVYSQTRNYCSPSLCPVGPHVACINSNVFAVTCPRDARVVHSSTIQNYMLNEHNRYRNDLAMGDLPGLERAMRMPTVLWDNELFLLASIWAKQCVSGYDICRNTDRFNAVGQNIYTALKPPNYSAASFITEAMEAWLAESNLITPELTTNYVPSDTYRRFAQLFCDKVTRIGCLIVDYTNGTAKQVTMVCTYNSSPRTEIYVIGCALAQCMYRSTVHPGLCAPNEVIDPNPF